MEYDDPQFDELGVSALAQLYPQQPVPQLKRPGFNAVIVNARQKGNPVLNGIKNVPWEYGDIQPDFVMGSTTCALFLSLKYHRLHPEYIYSRMTSLGKSFKLRVMLVLCDIDNHTDTLKELAKTCVVNSYTLLVSWSPAEAGRYIESFKSLEQADASEIKGIKSTTYSDQLVDVITSIRAINKSDAYSLIGTFGSLKKAVHASEEELSAIPGWGPQKCRNFIDAVRGSFATTNGTSLEKQEAVLTQTIAPKNGFYGPGKDVS